MKRKWTDTQLIDAVNNSGSIGETIERLGLCVSGGSYGTIKRAVERLSLDTFHFGPNNYRYDNKKISMEDILVKNSNYHGDLRKRIIDDELLEYRCAICGQNPEWNGLPLTLTLDHINGDHTDNRIRNLRFVCPNCDVQLPTFGGKNKPKTKSINTCIDCGVEISRNNTERCVPCEHVRRRVFVNRTDKTWPTKSELISMAENLGYEGTGRELGVSGNAVKKHILSEPN